MEYQRVSLGVLMYEAFYLAWKAPSLDRMEQGQPL